MGFIADVILRVRLPKGTNAAKAKAKAEARAKILITDHPAWLFVEVAAVTPIPDTNQDPAEK